VRPVPLLRQTQAVLLRLFKQSINKSTRSARFVALRKCMVNAMHFLRSQAGRILGAAVKLLNTSPRALKRTILWLMCMALSHFSIGTQAQNLQVRDDLDFGLMEIANLPGAAALGPDGSLTYSGGLAGSGFGVAGVIRVVGATGTTVDISCATSARVSNGIDDIRISSIVMVAGTSSATPSSGARARRCFGLGFNILQLTTGNQNQNTAYIGASMLTTGDESGGVYDTSTGGAIPITIEMVVP